MSKPVRLLLPAEQEMFDAACYYEKQASGLGQDFLNGIESALRHILEAPDRWPVVNAGVRRSLVRRFPYSLLYRVDPDEIIILAVMHQKRHPAYWLSRKQLK